MIQRDELEHFLNDLLSSHEFSDYGPNGLQIEGKAKVEKVSFAVSATIDSITRAIEEKSDALIVHHGVFWNYQGAKALVGPHGRRVIDLVKNEISLFAYHLPLDAHLKYGNAAFIAKELSLEKILPFGNYKGMPLGLKGNFPSKTKTNELEKKLEKLFNRKITVAKGKETLESIGIITGGANNDWVLAKQEGLDSYLTGEISEYNWHDAIEAGISYFACGHHASERGGVLSLKKLIEKKYSLETVFHDSDNPV